MDTSWAGKVDLTSASQSITGNLDITGIVSATELQTTELDTNSNADFLFKRNNAEFMRFETGTDRIKLKHLNIYLLKAQAIY